MVVVVVEVIHCYREVFWMVILVFPSLSCSQEYLRMCWDTKSRNRKGLAPGIKPRAGFFLEHFICDDRMHVQSSALDSFPELWDAGCP